MSDIYKEAITPGPVQRWIYAARPKTLLASVSPLLLSAAAALWFGCTHMGTEIHWGAFWLCVLFAGLMQIDSNLINDYVDFKKGTDGDDRLGPPRACAMGWIAPKDMMRGIIYVTLLACAVGLPLAVIGGWQMVGIGALCVLFAFLYSTWCSYHALGDLLVVVFFGIVPVFTTYYLLTFDLSWEVFLLSAGSGITTDTLLITNNYRDMDTDTRAGKKTLVTMLGRAKTRKMYLVSGYLAVLCTAPFFLTLGNTFFTSVWVGVSVFRLIQHRQFFYKEFISLPVEGLNKHLMHCSLSILSYAALYAAAIVAGVLVHTMH